MYLSWLKEKKPGRWTEERRIKFKQASEMRFLGERLGVTKRDGIINEDVRNSLNEYKSK